MLKTYIYIYAVIMLNFDCFNQACVQLGKWDIALKLLGTMERDGTQLATSLLRL